MKYLKIPFVMFALFLAILTGCEERNELVGPTFNGEGSDAFSKRGANRGSTVPEQPGAVYTMTNDALSNEVVAFQRSPEGRLSLIGRFETRGKGSGGEIDPLGSQGSVTLSHDGRWLFAVNAGSNEISVFEVGPSGAIDLTDNVSSGGVFPVSVTAYKDIVYVLNAGGGKDIAVTREGSTGNITGFRLSSDGKLSPIAGSTRPLSSRHLQTAPAQIQFTPNGEQLVVTEKATNVIDTYAINSSGLADGPKVQFSAGDTPFGFDFNKSGHLIVSEAFGGEPKASAVSSYQVSRGGEVQLVTESQATNQSAGCWVVVTKNGRFAYVSNTKSGTISGFKIRRDGSIALLNDDGLTADIEAKSFPIDMALSRSGGYLHVLNAGLGEISTFQVQKDGSLEIVPGVDEPNQLPVSAGVQGLAAF